MAQILPAVPDQERRENLERQRTVQQPRPVDPRLSAPQLEPEPEAAPGPRFILK